MAGIFISYRRDDASGHAGHLHHDLAQRFGQDRVFMDITALEPGIPFDVALEKAVTTSDILLAVIGPRWLSVTDESGRRRLDDPADFVRREAATALARDDIRVIPVLVGNAAMPAAEGLPEPLRAFANRHAFGISDERWDFDVGRLVERLRSIVKVPDRTAGLSGRGLNRRVAVPLLVALAGGGALAVWRWWEDDPDPGIRTSQLAVTVTPSVTPTPQPTPSPSSAPSTTAPVALQVACVGQSIDGPEEPVGVVALSPGGRFLAAASTTSGTVYVLDNYDYSAAPIMLTTASGQEVRSVTFSLDERRLALGKVDGSVELWEFEAGNRLSAPNIGHSGPVQSLAFSPDGTMLASGGGNGSVLLWKVATSAAPRSLQLADKDSVDTMAFSSDGQRLAIGRRYSSAGGSLRGSIRVWTLSSSEAPAVLSDNLAHAVASVAFSTGSGALGVGTGDEGGGDVQLWNLERGAPVGGEALAGFDDWTTSVAFQPDGQRLAAAGLHGTVRIWDAGQPVADVEGSTGTDQPSDSNQSTANPTKSAVFAGHHEQGVSSVAFARNGKLITATGTATGVELWACGVPGDGPGEESDIR